MPAAGPLEGETTGLRSPIDRPPEREVIPRVAGESFRWLSHDYPAPIARWNYHPELEIHLVRKSRGSYIIGDQVGTFEPGHVSIVGPNLPHDWVSDLPANEVILDRDAVIQFTEEWIARASLVIPELHGISSLVNSSRRGIVFSGPTAIAAAAEIESVGTASGPQRIGLLFSLLATFMTAPDSDRRYITDDVYTTDVGAEGKAAVDAGLAYMLENLTGRVSMAEAARLALMSESSFSKYFKRASGLTFSNMVKRLRIANACRLLDQTASSVSSISRAVGYTNLANFNRQFLTETGVAPRVYRALDHEHKPHSKLVGLGRVSALRTLS